MSTMPPPQAGAPTAAAAQQDDIQLRQATLADLPAVAALYSLSFADNPAYQWLFTGDVTVPAPEGALPWLFLRRARMLLHRGNCLLVGCRGDEIVAAGGVVPFSNKPGTWDYFRNGIGLWPLWWGTASLKRALGMDAGLVKLLGSGLSVAGELSMVAVHPELQGRGLGGRVMQALLEHWDAVHGGEGLLVMTQEAYALRLYAKFGFAPLDAAHPVSVHPQGGFHNWVMLRPGRQARGAAEGQAAGGRA